MQELQFGKIEELIHELRGRYVMLDSDLALLFGYKGGTKVINQALKRNIESFNKENYFQITDNELEKLKSQNSALKSHSVTSKEHGGSRKGHTVFTKEGIIILSGILRKNNVREIVNRIIKAFEDIQNNISKNPSIALSMGNDISDYIYIIRGKQVMLDYDLANIYKCSNGTKTINQVVLRHPNKFPSDFYFQLNIDEFINLKSQFGTSSWNNYGGVRKLPYAFY